jgi:drug/metabolite transporter (DMT)-like permease
MQPMNNGIFLAVASSVIFSFMNVMLKITGLNVPEGEIAFARGFIGLLLVTMIMIYKRSRLSSTDVPLLILRGFLGAAYVLVYIYAINRMKLSDLAILAQLSGVFVVFWNKLLLKEKIVSKAYLPLSGIFLGTLLIVKPGNFSATFLPAMLMVGAEILDGLVIIIVRYLAKSGRHSSNEIMFYFLLGMTLLPLPFFVNDFIMPNPVNSLILIAIGLLSFTALTFLTKAFARQQATIVEFTRYIGIVFNTIWGYFLFQEIPDGYTIGGGILISLCVTQLMNIQKG